MFCFVAWEVGLHEDVERWFLDLCHDEPATADGVADAIEQLVIQGPALGRPLADRIHASRHHNMKELRPPSAGASEVRVLFAFDPDRRSPLRRTPGSTTRREPLSARYSSWEQVKAKAAATDPRTPAEREAGQAGAVERREAYVRGHQLAEMRKTAGRTQAQVAELLGVSQARVSKIEHGEISGIDVIRAYVDALGGSLDIVATLGDRSWKVA